MQVRYPPQEIPVMPMRSGSTSGIDRRRECARGHVVHGVKGPLVGHGFIGVLEVAPAGRAASLVPLPLSVASFGYAPAGVHGDRRVAARDPEPDPRIERRAAAAVDQDDPGGFLAGFQLGDSDPGEYLRGLAFPRETVEENRLDSLGLEIGSGGVAGDGKGFRQRHGPRLVGCVCGRDGEGDYQYEREGESIHGV